MAKKRTKLEGFDEITTLPERQLVKPGCVFSLADSFSFIFFADEAGHLGKNQSYSKMIRKGCNWVKSKIWEEYRASLLSTALIHGGIDLLLPAHLSRTVSNAMSRKDGLDVLVDHPMETDKIEHMNKVYQHLFEISRKMESISDFTGIIPIENIDGKLHRHSQTIENDELGFLIEEYDYYLAQFAKQISVVTELSGPLFSAFISSQNAIRDTLHASNFDFRGLASRGYDINQRRSIEAGDIGVDFLIREMNAEPRKGLGILRDKEMEVLRAPFPLHKVKDIFDIISANETLSFEDYTFISLGALVSPLFGELLGFWLSWFEFQQMLKISTERSSAMCFNVRTNDIAEIGQRPEAIQLFRIYVTDINRMPRVDNYEDFLRLYHHPAIERFREQLAIWRQAVISGETNIVGRMRKDFRSALRDLSHAATLQTIGGMLTIIALPVAIGGILSGLPLDFCFTAVGPAVHFEGKRLANRASWVKFGDFYLRS